LPQLRKEEYCVMCLNNLPKILDHYSISAAAYWQNGSDTVTEHTAAISSGQRYPSYSEGVTNLTSIENDKQGLIPIKLIN
jgi:hypothetical protein